MLNTVLYAVNFGEFYYENLECFANYSRLGIKEIVLMHVIDPRIFQHSLYSLYNKEEEDKIRRFAEIKLEDIKKYLEKSGFGVRYIIKVGDIADEIAEEAEKENIDFVVLDKKAGRHKGYFSFYGSPLYDILMKVEKPVLILKRVILHASSGFKDDEKIKCSKLFEDIVLATDFSSFSLKAVPFILKLPREITKSFTILHVIEDKSVETLKKDSAEMENYEKKLAGKFEKVAEELGGTRTAENSSISVAVRKGAPYKEITDFMEESGKKLLVLGFKGREKENAKEIVFGSTVMHVINALPCSLLIVK